MGYSGRSLGRGSEQLLNPGKASGCNLSLLTTVFQYLFSLTHEYLDVSCFLFFVHIQGKVFLTHFLVLP